MKIKLAFSVFIATASITTSAISKENKKLWELSAYVIDNSIKCEIAQAYKEVGYKFNPQLSAGVIINIKRTETTKKKISLKFSELFITNEISGQNEYKTESISKFTRKISSENYINCLKNNKFSTGKKSCIVEALKSTKDNPKEKNNLECKTSTTATFSANAGASIPAWNITFGPEGSTEHSAQIDITIKIPDNNQEQTAIPPS